VIPDQPRQDALVDRVRKLLAKAESTTNPHEAEAFSTKAAELIAAHRIDVQHVRDSLSHGSLGLRQVPLGRGAYVRARLSLLMAVATNHDCEVVFQTGPDGTTAVVAGYESDLDITELLYGSLHTQAATQMATLRRRTPAATQSYRRAFLFGYSRRIGDLLAESRRRPAEPAAPSSPRRNAAQPSLFDEQIDAVEAAALPDLLARAERVKEFAARSFGRVSTAAPPRPAQASGWNDGHRAAGRADLGRQRIPGRKALGRGS
jgi:hypothetical protein